MLSWRHIFSSQENPSPPISLRTRIPSQRVPSNVFSREFANFPLIDVYTKNLGYFLFVLVFLFVLSVFLLDSRFISRLIICLDKRSLNSKNLLLKAKKQKFTKDKKKKPNRWYFSFKLSSSMNFLQFRSTFSYFSDSYSQYIQMIILKKI